MSARKALPKFVTSIKKRKALSLELKSNIIKDYESGLKNPQIALKYNLSQSTTLSIIKDKAKILDDIRNSSSLKLCKVRKRYGILAKMEDLMVVWCENQVNSANTILNASTVCEQAQSVFDELKKESTDNSKNKQFVASYEWLCQFRKRYSLDNIVDSIILKTDADKIKSEADDSAEDLTYGTQLLDLSQEPECIVQEMEETDSTSIETNSTNLVIKRKSLSFELKMNIINDFENGMKRSKISRKYKLAKSTVLTIIKERFKILEAIKNIQSLKSCKVQKRYGIIENMEKKLKAWCEEQTLVTNGVLEKSSVFEQANIIFNKLNMEVHSQNYKFVANEYWFKRFKKRWVSGKISKMSDSAEGLNINSYSNATNGENDFEETTYSSNYSPTSIFSEDDTKLKMLGLNGLENNKNVVISIESNSINLVKKRKALSLELKQNIIIDYEKGINRNKLARRYKLAPSTILTIIKSKAKILNAAQNLQTSNTFKIRKRNCIIDKMETLLKAWCEEQISIGNSLINQKVICAQAKLIFNQLKEEAGDEHKNDKFEASNGWYNLFRKRSSIKNSPENNCIDNNLIASKNSSINDIVNEFNFNKSEIKHIIPANKENNHTDLWFHKNQQQRSNGELNTIMKLSQGLECIEQGIRLFEEVDLDANRVATVRHDIEKAIVGYCKLLDSLSNRNTYHFMESSCSQ